MTWPERHTKEIVGWRECDRLYCACNFCMWLVVVPNMQLPVVLNVHVVGSWYDSTTCKVSVSRTGERLFKEKSDVWSFCTLPSSWVRTRWPKYRPRLDISNRYLACARIIPWFDHMQSIGVAIGPGVVPKNENNILPYWALTRRVSAHTDQYISPADCTFRL
jgi:hypothetical protein